MVSNELVKAGIKHNVLNAKFHASEADIVAQAGYPAAVTIATNMAGRGTDIKLGEGVVELGGLHILGTERHESRRIDNQLRGRSGRQGDPGSSRFYLSPRKTISCACSVPTAFPGSCRNSGCRKASPSRTTWFPRAIENAQKRVEGHHFENP